jgi:hypothetical protein
LKQDALPDHGERAYTLQDIRHRHQQGYPRERSHHLTL